MNKFNNIFWAVQKLCREHGVVVGEQQFQKICTEVGIPLERLHFYLDCIALTGVIEYLPKEKKILLTEKGGKAVRVFP